VRLRILFEVPDDLREDARAELRRRAAAHVRRRLERGPDPWGACAPAGPRAP
jgi:hypothetical protein